MEDRRDNLLAAKTFFLHFLDVCKSYTLLDKSELRKVEGDRVSTLVLKPIFVFLLILTHTNCRSDR